MFVFIAKANSVFNITTSPIEGFSTIVTDASGWNYIAGGGTSPGTVSNNTITINGGTLNIVYGGYVWNNGDAKNNTVNIAGGSIGNVYGGSVGDGSADNNSVTVSGGTVNNYIYGGAGATWKF